MAHNTHFPSSPSQDSLLSSSSYHSTHLRNNHSSSSFRSPPARTPPPIRSTSGYFGSRSHRSTSISGSLRDALKESEVNDDGDDDDDDDDDEDEDEEHGGGRVASLGRRGKAVASAEDEEQGEEDAVEEEDDDPVTVKDRQSLINVQHPFGLPLWKPALYQKSRSVTRHADAALHSIPSAQAERHLLPGNIFWGLAFGWWLAIVCIVLSALLFLLPQGGKRYASLVYGLGWYLAWPFGKYVEGELHDADSSDDEENMPEQQWSEGSEANTVRGMPLQQSSSDDAVPSSRFPGVPLSEQPTITPETAAAHHVQSRSLKETTPLRLHPDQFIYGPQNAYGATGPPSASSPGSIGIVKENVAADCLGKACFWLAMICIIAPLMLIACMICWGLVVTIPMAKLNWALIKHLFEHPTSIRFCAAPSVVVMPSEHPTGDAVDGENVPQPSVKVKHTRLSPGQLAPSGSPTSTVLLCTYRAVGLQYYKYTVGGVNILFVNLIPVVFFVIFDGMVLLKMVERLEHEGKHVPAFLAMIASRSLIFFLCLLSVIPLSYFIGMAVASISAQSSIGMGAVINATFGSIIEILLYSIALTQSKGRLVEGSIVGSLLAGVLLMPGMSMCSGALRRKELKFNAKSAGVTSMMLIMAIIGALTPTLFYQTYGNVFLYPLSCYQGH
jgi:Ca2+:H+ antiporter